MKVLVCESPGTLTYAHRDIPNLGRNEALLRIHRVGICGTDLHAFEGVQPYFNYPRILGHELAAEFIDGDGNGFNSGCKVTMLPYYSCNFCIACRNGKPNCCVNIKVCGVHVDGGMAEYLVVPFSSIVDGEGLTFNELALVEPLAIGTHALKRARVSPGEFVLIIGAGPIGLGIMEIAFLQEARVIAMDISDSRLQFCQSQIPEAWLINPSKANVTEQLMNITGGDLPTLVVDATGNLNAINQAFQWIAHGGRYVLVGLQKNEINLSHPEFHKREATLMSSRNATRDDFDYVIQQIKEGNIIAEKFITHTIAFDSVRDAFPALSNHNRGVVKAVVDVTGISSNVNAFNSAPI